MAMNPIQHRGLESSDLNGHKYFPVYCSALGRPKRRKSISRLIRRHPILVLILIGLVIAGANSFRGFSEYWNTEILFTWRCEFLAAALFALTIQLFRTFRRWEKERRRLRRRRVKVDRNVTLYLDDTQNRNHTSSAQMTEPETIPLIIDSNPKKETVLAAGIDNEDSFIFIINPNEHR